MSGYLKLYISFLLVLGTPFGTLCAEEEMLPFAKASPPISEAGDSMVSPSLSDVPIGVSVAIKHKKPFKPFAGLPIEGLKDVSVANVVLKPGVATYGSSFTLLGDVTVMGLTAQCQISYWRIVTTGKNELLLRAFLGKSISLGKLMPFLKGSFLEHIVVGDPLILISTFQYEDPGVDLTLRPGINILGTVDLAKSGILSNIETLTDSKFQPLTLFGSIGIKREHLSIAIVIPATFKFPNPLWKSGAVRLEMSGEPSVGLLTSLTIQPSEMDEPITFHVEVKLEPDEAYLAGTFEGIWKDVFGLKGMNISDVALEVAVPYGPAISAIGFTGRLKLGKEFGVGVKLDKDPMKALVYGSLDSLSLRDLVTAVTGMGARIPLKAIPTVGFEDIEVKIVPYEDTEIGEILFEKGITIKGTVNFFGKKAMIDLNANDEGIKGQAFMSKLAFGPLAVTGAGLDAKYGTSDDGPILKIQIDPEKQDVLMSGRVNIVGIQKDVEIRTTKDGMSFTMKGNIFGIYRSTIVVTSGGPLTNPDFYFKAAMENDFTRVLQDTAKKVIKELSDEAKIRKRLNNSINTYNNLIKDRKKKIKDEEKRYKKLKAWDQPGALPKSLGQRGIWAGEIIHYGSRRDDAKNELKNLKTTMKITKAFTGTIGKFIAEGKPILDLQHASLEGSLKDMKQGKSPRLRALAYFLGKKYNVDAHFNVKKPAESAWKFVLALKDRYIKGS